MAKKLWNRDGKIARGSDGKITVCETCPTCGTPSNCGPCPTIPASVIVTFDALDGSFNIGSPCSACDDGTFGNNVPHVLTYRADLSTPSSHQYRKEFSPALCTSTGNSITYINFFISCEEYWDDATQTGWNFTLAYGGAVQHFNWTWQADPTTGNPIASGAGLGWIPPVSTARVNFTCSSGSLEWALGEGFGDSSLACAVPTAAPGRAGPATVEWTV